VQTADAARFRLALPICADSIELQVFARSYRVSTTTVDVQVKQVTRPFLGLRTVIAAVIVLFAIIYFGSAFTPGLQDDADASHAEAAREMASSGDFVTLHINGVRYLEKAPMLYWLVAVSYRVFGANEFATRLPTIIALLLTVLLGIRWAQRAFGDREAIYAGLFVSTAVGYYLFTRILIPEAILSLLIGASLYSFLTALELPQQWWRWYLGWACLAFAVLTKGLLALVVVGGAIVLYLAITGEWRRWREFRLLTGIALAIAIAAPWHLLAGFRNPRFFWFYFVNEHFLRFLGKRIPKDYNKLPAYLYWGLHLVWLFPWSLYLPVAVRRLYKDYKARQASAQRGTELTFKQRTQLMCVLWASITLVFFSFSTNQEYYTFPVYLPILLLISSALTKEEDRDSRWLTWISGVMAVVSVAASLVLIAGLWSSRHLPFVPDIGTVLAKPDLNADTLSMGHMLDLTGESFAALRLPAGLAAIALLLGPSLALWFRTRARHTLATWATAITMAGFLIAAHIALVRFDPYLGSKTIAADVAREIKPADRMMIYGDQAFGSSLLFYLKRPVELVNGKTTSMWFGSTYPDAPHIWITDAELRQAWTSQQRVFLFVPSHERARVEAAIPGEKLVYTERSGKIVYTNHR
jgi:4-amino-4-deoxy-L-arabinose transferase-like glycosyltransferase